MDRLHLKDNMSKDCRAFEKPTTYPSHEATLATRVPLRRGDRCPQCGQGSMDYDGLLNLSCPLCGYTDASGGSFT
jgi:uncharacterized protein (DUF983 family)